MLVFFLNYVSSNEIMTVYTLPKYKCGISVSITYSALKALNILLHYYNFKPQFYKILSPYT